MTPGDAIEALVTVGRTFGVRGLWLRTRHEWRKSRDAFRAAPRHPVSVPGTPLAMLGANAERLRRACDLTQARARADHVAQGQHEAYRFEWRARPVDVASWNASPDGTAWWPDRAWWRVPHYAPGRDIKDVWEPARMAWLFDLVRGWYVTGDPRYVEAAIEAIAGFIDACPPFRGPQWACGQETSIRAVALLYAEAAFHALPAWDRVRLPVARLLGASGERVADAIGYAISQRNNHGISEAMGLVLLGHRCAGVHPEAASWRERGARWLDRLVLEQFAEDGWYIQHSFTYLRVAVDQCVIASRVAPLSRDARTRLARAGELLTAVIDPDSGLVPNHGNNDGAFVHPVTSASYRDFRPVLTALAATTDLPVPANVRADPEVLAWLDRPMPATGAPIGDGIALGRSGWATVRRGSTFIFLRAGEYRSRPGHLDALHLDVRSGGHEVIVDPGTYRYVRDATLPQALDGDAMHNGLAVAGWSLGRRGPRFLWYKWPRAHLAAPVETAEGVTLEADAAGVVHRQVRVRTDRVDVHDTVAAGLGTTARVRWLLGPGSSPDVITISGASRVVAAPGTSDAWFSPRYGQLVAVASVSAVADASQGADIRTTILTTGVAHGAGIA